MAGRQAKRAPLPSPPPPDEQLCKRSDGKGWRCKKPQAEGGYGFCESHHQQMLARSRVRVSGGAKGGRRAGRGRRPSKTKPLDDGAVNDQVVNVPSQGAVVGDEEEISEAGGEDLEGKEGDSAAEVGSETRKGEKDLMDGKGVLESGGALKDSKNGAGAGKRSEDQGVPPSKLADGPLHQCSFMGDEAEKKSITRAAKDLKRKDLEKVYGRKKKVNEDEIVRGKLHSPVRVEKPEKLELKDDAGRRLYTGRNFKSMHDKNPDVGTSENRPKQDVILDVMANENIVEATPDHNKNPDGEGYKNKPKQDAQAPSSSPSSPNIGESSHQASLLFQTKVHSCNQPPGPSTSTTSMADKNKEGGENKTINVMLEDMKSGRARSIQRAKRARRSDEFSVSRCAAVLNEMTDFTAEELVKASRVFVKPFNREMFLSLKDKLRIVWLREQISD